MEKIYSTQRYSPVPKNTPWGFLLVVYVTIVILAIVLWQAALIGGREAHAAAKLLTPGTGYLATPPGLTDEMTIKYYEAPTDTPVWVDLTPGRPGLTN